MPRAKGDLRLTGRLVDRLAAAAQAQPNSFWERQFELLAEVVDGMGYEVSLEPKAEDRVELGESKTIIINSTKRAESRFYTLLHEVGHILIRRNWKRFSRDFPKYLLGPNDGHDRRRERGRSYQVALIAEEIEAWRRGLAFARRKGYHVDPIKYDRESSESVHSYIVWSFNLNSRTREAGQRAAKARRRSGR